MKRLFFGFIWQWKGGAYIGFNPISIEFVYEKFEPSISVSIVILGVGVQILWLCPWETVESQYAKECAKQMQGILSLGGDLGERDRSGDV
jgi:hypothetical protein